MSTEQPTRPDGPNALEVLRESVKLLGEAHSMIAQALETQQESRNRLVECTKLIEQVQELLEHGIARELKPISDRVDKLEAQMLEVRGILRVA